MMIRSAHAAKGLSRYLALILLAAGPALAGAESETTKPLWSDEQAAELMKMTEGAQEYVARKQYGREAAEIALRANATAASSQDNAAFLYYQALLARREIDPCTIDPFFAVTRGGEPDYRVRTYLGLCLRTIELAHTASQMSQCDWGLTTAGEQGLDRDLVGSLRQLCFILDVDARTLAADGHGRAALARCLTIRRLAQHTSDDTYFLYATSQTIDGTALRAIRHVLSTSQLDQETLAWLEGQLAAGQGAPFRPAQALRKWRDEDLEFWRTRPQGQPFTRESVAERIKGAEEDVISEVMAHTDEELLLMLLEEEHMFPSRHNVSVPPELIERAQQACDDYLRSAVQIMEADIPYREKETRLKKMTHSLDGAAGRGDPISLLPIAPRTVGTYYRLRMQNSAYLSALKAAVGVCLVKADTGQFPQALPDGLPKDPLSGGDFAYERTEKGFVLRFDPDKVSGFKTREFEFAPRDE